MYVIENELSVIDKFVVSEDYKDVCDILLCYTQKTLKELETLISGLNFGDIILFDFVSVKCLEDKGVQKYIKMRKEMIYGH